MVDDTGFVDEIGRRRMIGGVEEVTFLMIKRDIRFSIFCEKAPELQKVAVKRAAVVSTTILIYFFWFMSHPHLKSLNRKDASCSIQLSTYTNVGFGIDILLNVVRLPGIYKNMPDFL
jgi:hypothetical protein